MSENTLQRLQREPEPADSHAGDGALNSLGPRVHEMPIQPADKPCRTDANAFVRKLRSMTLAELEQWMTPAGAGKSAFQTCEELQRMSSQSAKKAGVRLKIELTKAVERLLARAQSLFEAEQQATTASDLSTGGSRTLTVESAIRLIMSTKDPLTPPEQLERMLAADEPAKASEYRACTDSAPKTHGDPL